MPSGVILQDSLGIKKTILNSESSLQISEISIKRVIYRSMFCIKLIFLQRKTKVETYHEPKA